MDAATMTTAETAAAEPEIHTFLDATVYMLEDMGMGFRGTHFKAVHLTVKPWAQYPRAVELEGLRPRCKRQSWRGGYRGRVVVVRGKAPERPVPLFGDALPGSAPGVEIRRGRHSSCSPAWGTDFAAWLDAEVAAGRVTVLLDETIS